MAQVKDNQFIYDPFVGSGSLLIGAAHFNAYVMGADLDYNLIHSKGLSSRMGQKYRKQSETIRNNLKQYDLENKYLDVLIADFSTSYIRNDFKFDAIITDPPYVSKSLKKSFFYLIFN
jgi:tRNA (guanine10-N2)-methyltransferase